jgi:hypothetical protein
MRGVLRRLAQTSPSPVTLLPKRHSDRQEPSTIAASAAPYVVGAVLAGLLVAPFALRQNSWGEWANAYWLLHEQTDHVRRTGLPTYMVSTSASGVDYPIYVFYGGFTLTALSYLAVLTSTWFVFVLSLVIGFAIAYVGIYWTGRAIGLSRVVSSLLATIAVCTPYFVTNLYGRGAWA